MKLNQQTQSWKNGLFEITEILCVLSMCLMWEGMKSREFESHYIWNFWKEILNKVLTSKKTWQLTWKSVCTYNLCLTLSLSSYRHFPQKIDIEFLLRTLRNNQSILLLGTKGTLIILSRYVWTPLMNILTSKLGFQVSILVSERNLCSLMLIVY